MSTDRYCMLSVYPGRDCIGFIVTRGKTGFEAFDADQRSLGIFSSEKQAADAVSTSASEISASAEKAQPEAPSSPARQSNR